MAKKQSPNNPSNVRTDQLMMPISEREAELQEQSVIPGLPQAGLVQTKTHYSTAVQVIKPRDLQVVLRRCLEEAAIAGDLFYYSWKQGGETIEGLTIGAAQSIVRNFGNCVVEVQVEELPLSYIFNGGFIDLETGFNLIRPFRQSKVGPVKKDGTRVYKDERGMDIVFQIGASKAMRNAILNACPRWLSDRVMSTAKDNVLNKIKTMGIEKAKDMLIRKAGALKIDMSRIQSIYGKTESWEPENVVQISSALRAIEDGTERVDDLFPEKTVEKTKDEKKEEPVIPVKDISDRPDGTGRSSPSNG